MRVLLISANTERTNILPLPLGPALVAAATRRAGHEVILRNLMFGFYLAPRLSEWLPERVAAYKTACPWVM